MKTAVKLLITLRIISNALFWSIMLVYLVFNVINASTHPWYIYFASMILFLVIFVAPPFVIGIIALKKIKVAQAKSQLKGVAILTLLFCSFLGGIIMLCIDDKDLAPAEPQQ